MNFITMRQQIKTYLFCILLLALGCSKKTPETPTQTATIPVRTTAVTQQHIQTTLYTSGKTISQQTVQLSFKVGGHIKHIAVREGDTVQKQDTLAILDQTEIRAHHTQAVTAYQKAYQDFQKAQKLQSDNVLTNDQLLNAKVALETARSARNIATYNLSHSVITAPTHGRILKKMGEKRELIGVGSPLFIFAPTTATYALRAGLTDRDILWVTLGDSATVTFDAHPNVHIPAKVDKIAATASPQTGLFDIELALKTQHTLLPGMIGQAHIHTQYHQDRLTIPIEALIDADSDRGFVYVLKDSIVFRRAIVLDKLQHNAVLVKEGLTLGEQVVTDGASYLRDQAPVTTTP